MQLTDTTGDWVTRHPATARVFERHGIDYCCGGGRRLEEACREAQVDTGKLLAELTEVMLQNAPDNDDGFTAQSLSAMCDAIEATHHEFLRRGLPRLKQLVDKVHAVHGDAHPWLGRLATSFQDLCDELMPHMMKEERILFPAIRGIEQTQTVPSFPFGSVENPIRMMEHEHDAAGRALKTIRTVSDDYTLPEGGCNTFRVMLDGLRELEADLHRHIHKENNILFPRALRLASELSALPTGAEAACRE